MAKKGEIVISTPPAILEDDRPIPTLDPRQRMFVEAYFGEANFNAMKAAKIAGYNIHHAQYLLTQGRVADEIHRRIDMEGAKTNEIIAMISRQARGHMGHFYDENGKINLKTPAAKENIALIKEIEVDDKKDRQGNVIGTKTKIKIHDAQAALALMGRARGIFVDKTETIVRVEEQQLNAIIDALPTQELKDEFIANIERQLHASGVTSCIEEAQAYYADAPRLENNRSAREPDTFSFEPGSEDADGGDGA